MTQLQELSKKKFHLALTNIVKNFCGNGELSLHAHMGSFSRDREPIGKKQMGILKIKSIVIGEKMPLKDFLVD